MLFKLWSADKMKTFKTEEELNAFANEKGLVDVVVLRLIPDGNGEDTLKIQVKDELKGWDTNAYLFLHEDNTWSWTEDFHSGSKQYEKVNDTLKDFVRTRRNQAGGENARYSIYDVYSPSELGVFVRD